MRLQPSTKLGVSARAQLGVAHRSPHVRAGRRGAGAPSAWAGAARAARTRRSSRAPRGTPAGRPAARRNSAFSTGGIAWSASAAPMAPCAGTGGASRPWAGSSGRTGSPTSRCRPPRRARRSGRDRGPSAAEWNILPSKRLSPGRSGSDGSCSGPVATTSDAARPSGPASCRAPTAWRSSFQRRAEQLAAEAHLSTARRGRSATCSRYSWISGCSANTRLQSGLRANENEYSDDGTSHAQPG